MKNRCKHKIVKFLLAVFEDGKKPSVSALHLPHLGQDGPLTNRESKALIHLLNSTSKVVDSGGSTSL